MIFPRRQRKQHHIVVPSPPGTGQVDEMLIHSQDTVKPVNPSEVASRLTIDDGVFKPDEGSIALAGVSLTYPGRFLDLGTGSGFIAIVKALNGERGDATDVSKKAITCAGKNFNAFGVANQVGLVESNGYAQVEDRYDLIIYSPPTSTDESEGERRMKNLIKAKLPGSLSRLLSGLFQRLNAKQRRERLLEDIRQSQDHLNPGGTLLLDIPSMDADYLQEHSKDVDMKKVNKTKSNTILEIKPR